MALDATPGGQFANSYVTMSEATTLLQERLATDAWYAEDANASMTLPARREAALLWATRLIDEQIGWYSTPTTLTQALAWPQVGQIDHLGRLIDSTVVPRFLKMATALTALHLMGTEAVVGTAALEPGVKSKRIGDMEIVYQDDATQRQELHAAVVPAEVLTMLRPYGTVPGLGMIPVLRT